MALITLVMTSDILALSRGFLLSLWAFEASFFSGTIIAGKFSVVTKSRDTSTGMQSRDSLNGCFSVGT